MEVKNNKTYDKRYVNKLYKEQNIYELIEYI